MLLFHLNNNHNLGKKLFLPHHIIYIDIILRTDNSAYNI